MPNEEDLLVAYAHAQKALAEARTRASRDGTAEARRLVGQAEDEVARAAALLARRHGVRFDPPPHWEVVRRSLAEERPAGSK